MQKQNDFAAYREGEVLEFMLDMARIRLRRATLECSMIEELVVSRRHVPNVCETCQEK